MAKKKNGIAVGGILTGFTILVLGFLFQQGFFEFRSGPDLRITEAYAISAQWANSDMNFKIEVFNQGNKVAENCLINFDNDVNDSIEGKRSGMFSVKPNQSYELQFSQIRYEKSDKYTYQAYVQCQNYAPSKPITFSIDIQGN